jgi:tripartite-type tricarboxylate transporter receptor subunit TctC
LPNFHISLLWGFWMPKGTPKDIVARVNAAVVETLADPAVQKRVADQGLDMPAPDQRTPEALAAYQKAEIDKWWPIIKSANIRGQQ